MGKAIGKGVGGNVGKGCGDKVGKAVGNLVGGCGVGDSVNNAEVVNESDLLSDHGLELDVRDRIATM